ncbi:MAG: hypothetical protein JWQ83_1152 [Lacunisphaera sp.]|nr:hypothetical protein [Lacunisphaera sp.]
MMATSYTGDTMNSKDSPSPVSAEEARRYWLLTVLEDRAECAGAPVVDTAEKDA